MAKFKTLYLTVPSDSNIAVFEDNIITDTSVIEFYTDDDNIYPIALSQSGNTVNVTLSNHTSDVHCCLTVNNISEFETPLNASDIIYYDTTVYDELMEHRFEINQLGTAIGTLNTAIGTLGSEIDSKQDVLIPGANITIEDNVISAIGGSGIDYSTDEQNTGVKWVDGSDIYRKVLIVNTNNSVLSVGSEGNYGISNNPIGVARWLKADFITYDASSSLTVHMFGGVVVKAIRNYNGVSDCIVKNTLIGTSIKFPPTSYIIVEYIKG